MNSLPIKRGRGRPSKASLAAAAAAATAAAINNESISSLGTSTYSSADSVSGYSTPLTSNVTTPAPVDNAKSASTRSTRSSNVEAASPAVKSRGSGTKSKLKAERQPMDTSSRATRRNRLVVAVPDSDDEDLADDSPNARRIRHDEEIARSLQDELNREVEGILFDDDLEEQPMVESDSEDYAATDPKGKGKAVATRKASGTRAAAKKRVVQDSDIDDDDDYDDDDSDFADLAPPAKKQKTAIRGRGKQASAKGKGVVAPLASDSDDDLPCK